MLSRSIINTTRFQSRQLAKSAIGSYTSRLAPSSVKFATAGSVNKIMSRSITTAKSIIYSEHGVPKDVISVHTHQLPDPKDNEVILKSLGFPINPSDINQLEGVYPSKPEKTTQYGTEKPSAIAGNEGLFEVIEKGSNVKLELGDHVIPLHSNSGTWTSHQIAPEDQLIKLPKDVSVIFGATISVNPTTAYQLVNDFGLEKGDWLIQNAGTSAVSQAVSQIAKTKGINVISVIRDRPNLQEIKDKLVKQGAAKVITEEENGDRTVGGEISKLTQGKIKIALNSVSGKSSSNISRKLAPGGTIITYGGMSKQPVTLPTSLFIFKDIKAIGFWVTEGNKRDPEGKRQTINELVKLYQNGHLEELQVHSNEWNYDSFSDEQIKNLIVDALENSSGGKQFITVK
ncbi:2-enoyl thioester reductase [Wickerhamomyces ciferrii]|uniref:enoyl-[acyl-carrier-protein] reductase n=1 Tax=Wickerhamomyces ciferrii (strain ATCC 14091 / BCRC 22168 / CBS 111 / JCM 3599 / NBRC 0793 / NRRL Y-1031 F-60-10) TaxID=1206466 RepID=K0KFU1_WICCF|nr:2-enoyl thioester reductase [Wickerhamomyces ciferrii]CCH41097.1 2-enoyl thioester reductase [Wickerhamomyces ciferrii]